MSGVPIEMTVSGADDLVRKFERLNRRMQQSILGKAGRKALDQVMYSARQGIQTLPFGRTDSKKAVRVTLLAALRKRTSNKQSTTIVSLFLDYKRGGAVRLAHLFEFGFNHPGGRRMPDYRMLTDAWESKQQAVHDEFVRLMRELMKEATPS